MVPLSLYPLLVASLGIVAVGGLVLGILQYVRPSVTRLSTSARLLRSLLVGVGTAMFVFSVLALFLIRGGAEALQEFNLPSIAPLICVALPCGLVAAAGSIVGLLVVDSIQQQAHAAKDPDKDQGRK